MSRRTCYRLLARLAGAMVWSISFELVITPQYAGHYNRVRADLEKWRAIQNRYQVRGSF
jgi:hypothetical protein